MKNIGIIRKIAWSFHNSTNLELEDLFQEAALAYCESLKNYDPKRGKLTTYMWHCISSHLKNYLKEQEKQNGHICSIEDINVNHPVFSKGYFEMLSKEAQEIAEVILADPYKYLSVAPELARKMVAREMVEQKDWSWRRVWVGIRDLKLAFS